MEYDYLIKTIIIGDSSVGKSNIITKFVDDEFTHAYCSTIGVDYKTICVDYLNKIVKIIIWDTAGQERFKTITRTFYKGAHVVIICFDLTNRETFENVDYWLEEINKEHLLNPIIVLVGTKTDLSLKRIIIKEEALKKVSELKFKGYFETSAKTYDGIEEMFLNIIKLYCSFDDIDKIKKIKLNSNLKNNTNVENKKIKNNFFKSFCNII
jgi:Ras-related protein Rab-1A